MGSKQKVLYGPWPGGMHSAINPHYIADTELAHIENFDIMDDGGLITRAGLKNFYFSQTYTLTNPADVTQGVSIGAGKCRLLGSEFVGGVDVPLVMVDTPTPTVFKLRRYNLNDGTYTEVLLTGNFGVNFNGYCQVVEYNNVFYFIGINGADSFSASTASVQMGGATTLVSSIPAPSGANAFMFKDRMFLFNGSRVYYSKATDPTIWAAPDGGFFDVNPDTTDPITAIVVSNDNLYIFKHSKTFMFTFLTDPAIDGVLREVVSDKGALVATVYRNVVYTSDNVSTYIFQNGYFQDIGSKVRAATFVSGSIFVWDNRLFVLGASGKFGTSGFWVMNLQTGAWSIYTFNVWNYIDAPAVRIVRESNGTETLILSAYGNLYVMKNTRHNSLSGYQYDEYYDHTLTLKRSTPNYRVVSKAFDFGSIMEWKKLFRTNINLQDQFNRGKVTLLPTVYDSQDFTYDSVAHVYTKTSDGIYDESPSVRPKFAALPVGKSIRFKDLQLAYEYSDLISFGTTGYYEGTSDTLYLYKAHDPANDEPVTRTFKSGYAIDAYGVPYITNMELFVALKSRAETT